MAIKAIINNTEKEIEQIKNSDEQDIDYVYSRIGDTEVEGEPPISIKSIGGNLTNYRIYGQTVDGESVGDLVTSGEHAGEYKVPVTVAGKNELQNTATSQTKNGVTFTVNSDGSVTCNGTATQTAVCTLNDTFSLEPGKYKLTGCPAGGGHIDKYKLDIVAPPISYGTDIGNGSSFTVSSTLTNTQYRIVIYNNQVCNNLTFYPMIRKADIEDDTYEPYHAPVTVPIYLPEPIKMVGDEAEYIDYGEQKMHRIGADDIDVTLPALSTIKGTNTLSVNTSIQPSNMYIKDNDYKKVFTATRAIEDELPLNYKNIEDNDSALSNYRIYGNTVGGESVGDLVESGEHAGEYKADVTVSNGTDTLTTPIYLPEPLKMVDDEAEYIEYGEQKQHRVRKNLWSGVVEQGNVSQYGVYGSDNKRIRSKNVPIEPGTYMISSNVLMRIIYAYNDDQKIGICLNSADGVYSRSFTVPAGANNIAISMMKRVAGVQVDITPSDFIWGQIEKGSEATTYEPYIENTDLNVTLPALPTLSGTNTLSVGTEVQPSRVYLKGKIKEIN